ncbi:MAG: glycosyltransferase family 2 protein [Elusimicrobia bacterium]|nr:glycosyltransferase family 2 protein [Elusimicrobiota bacterium]
MLKLKLQIYLITYNRLEYLKRTFSQIFSKESPIRDFDITILDNASTDGTYEFIEEYCRKFSNIKHIRHNVNIGGNANICRAFEMSAGSGKEYVWVLCDDDYYDWSNWEKVEKLIEEKIDIICVSNYLFPNENEFNNKSYQLPQLTFVPAGIYRTELITNDVILNMYENIFTMFQQSCISIYAINENKKIKVLNKQIVDNGLYHNVYMDVKENLSFSRGVDKKSFISERMSCRNWILGLCNITTLLKDKSLQRETIESVISGGNIYKNWNKFFNSIVYDYFVKDKFNYFYEIYKSLNKTKKMKLFFTIFNPIDISKRFIKKCLKFCFNIRTVEVGKDYKISKVLFLKIKRKR